MSKKALTVGGIISAVAILLVVTIGASGLVAISVLNSNSDDATTTTTQCPSTTEQVVNAVPKVTETTTTKAVTQPEELTQLLEKTGYDYDDLKGTRQLLVVTGGNGDYYLQRYECTDGVWQSTGVKSKAFVGKNGTISPDKKFEGDYYSPQGLYDLGFAFGKNKNPGTNMEYRDVYEGIYWVDDPKSEFYNQWVDGKNQEISWASAEKLWTYDEYIYGAVIEYNTDPIAENKGSAIFLHVGYKYTAGCVASDEATIVSVLKWLNPKYNPKILIY